MEQQKGCILSVIEIIIDKIVSQENIAVNGSVHIEEKPDLKVGDVIELDGKRWRMTKDGFNMSFENLDSNDKEQAFSHVGGLESFKEAHDYKLVDEAKEKEKPSGSDDEKGLQRKTKNDTMSKTAKKESAKDVESQSGVLDRESGADGVGLLDHNQKSRQRNEENRIVAV